VDSGAIGELPGPVDLPSALAGRVVGLWVTTPATVGGSAPVVFRGPRSIVGTNQPLWVVDGVPIDDSNITTSAQRFGFGGFDYGSGAQDLNLGDVALVQMLSGAEGSALYGGRAANGVILVTTKKGEGLNGFVVAVSQLVSAESPLRLPSFQNVYGQGLDGAYAFFNGKGAGVNDSVTQSWGPALNGQPIPQASLTEPGRADVRQWLARPDNVRDFFQSGHTFTTNVSAQGSNGSGHYRLSFNNRDGRGMTPQTTVARRGGAASGGVRITPALSVSAQGQYVNDQGRERPGTGYDEINPVAGFSRFGRQLDLDALRAHLRDSTDTQITWVYTNRNNPYFEPLLNSNRDERSRWLGGATVSYAMTDWLTAAVRGGLDTYDEVRTFNVATGWIGGYPYYAGRGSFSAGGRQRSDIDVRETSGDVTLQTRSLDLFASSGKPSNVRVAFSAGAGRRGNSMHLDATALDRATDSTTTPTPLRLAVESHTNTLFAGADFDVAQYLGGSVALHQERSSVFGAGDDSHLYPSASLGLDLKRAISSLQGNRSVDGAQLRAGLWRAANNVTPYLLRAMYSGVQSPDGVALANTPTAASNAQLQPETTQGFEVGIGIQILRNRLGLDATMYSERTSDLFIPVVGASSTVPANSGTVSNKGLELMLSVVPVTTTTGFQWEIAGHYAKNRNRVESLTRPGNAPLGPTRWGVTLEARPGVPLGAIVGTALRRNGSSLVLENGLPVADTGASRVLGSIAPSWTGGLSNTFRVGGLEISALLDARIGGSIFSATNMWGSYAGVLDATAFRPDSGLLIDGVDPSGKPNSTNVSAQAYYHALGSIVEPWVYDATVVKLRDVRLAYTIPMTSVPGFSAQSARISLIGRNLALWAKAPNIDPETALSTSTFQGMELGQLPSARSIGFQVTITP
jgi:TonB-dependent SusC/RagA subfamily outer membrane receptor